MEIRDTTNKYRILGDYVFKQQSEMQAGPRASPQMLVTDRTPEKYQAIHLLYLL